MAHVCWAFQPNGTCSLVFFQTLVRPRCFRTRRPIPPFSGSRDLLHSFASPNTCPRPFSHIWSIPHVFALGAWFRRYWPPVNYSTWFHGRTPPRRPFSHLWSTSHVFIPGARWDRFCPPVTYNTWFRGRTRARRPFSRLRSIPHIFVPGAWWVRFLPPVTYSTWFHGWTRARRPFSRFQSIPHVFVPFARWGCFDLLWPLAHVSWAEHVSGDNFHIFSPSLMFLSPVPGVRPFLTSHDL
jgi:hypothetical protein